MSTLLQTHNLPSVSFTSNIKAKFPPLDIQDHWVLNATVLPSRSTILVSLPDTHTLLLPHPTFYKAHENVLRKGNFSRGNKAIWRNRHLSWPKSVSYFTYLKCSIICNNKKLETIFPIKGALVKSNTEEYAAA